MSETAHRDLVGELTDEVAYRILRTVGLAVVGAAEAAAVQLAVRRWHEVERHWPMRRRDPWLARWTPGPDRAGSMPPDTPIDPEPPHEDAPAFSDLADLHEIGHRWVPRAPPCP